MKSRQEKLTNTHGLPLQTKTGKLRRKSISKEYKTIPRNHKLYTFQNNITTYNHEQLLKYPVCNEFQVLPLTIIQLHKRGVMILLLRFNPLPTFHLLRALREGRMVRRKFRLGILRTIYRLQPLNNQQVLKEHPKQRQKHVISSFNDGNHNDKTVKWTVPETPGDVATKEKNNPSQKRRR